MPKNNYRTEYTGGRVRSSSLPANRRTAMDAGGRLLRGVVVATYRQDEDVSELPVAANKRQAIYCDVYVYGNGEANRRMVLNGVMVLQAHGGMHEGHIWVPRAARQSLTKGSLGQAGFEPTESDGDHVLVGFLDGNINSPVIMGSVPHPHYDKFNDSLASGIDQAGHRMKMTLIDGEPDFWKHRGTYHGVDKDGNYIVDSTRAHGGEYTKEGQESPAGDEYHGNQTHNVPSNAEFNVRGLSPEGDNTSFQFRISRQNALIALADDVAVDIQIGGGAAMRVEGNEATAALTLGDGLAHAAKVEELEALYQSFKTVFDNHFHLEDGLRSLLSVIGADFTALGSSIGIGATSAAAIGLYNSTVPPAAPQPPAAPAPDWDPTINSDKVSFPK